MQLHTAYAAIDSLVAECRRPDAPNDPTIRQRALAAILQASEVPVPTGRVSDDSALRAITSCSDAPTKRRLAICLLRILPVRQFSWLLEQRWRPVLVSLFDATVGTQLYQRRIDHNSQAHEKLEACVLLLTETEQTFSASLAHLTSLDRAGSQRQKLMASLNSQSGRVAIQPFLPETLPARLAEIYGRVDSYLSERDGLGVVDARSRATADLNQFADDLEKVGTIYAKQIASDVARKLATFIDEDFASNKAAKPAALSIEPRDKKYPLHRKGDVIRIGFTVRNAGPGFAYDASLIIASDRNVFLANDQFEIGRIEPNGEQLVEVAATVCEPTTRLDILAELSWREFDQSSQRLPATLAMAAQRHDVDWDLLARSAPYSLEPVSNDRDLVGRRDMLDRLLGITSAPAVGSAVIHGQKRVGKTSVARALQSTLESEGWLVIYIEGGDYVDPSAARTIARLGEQLCAAIRAREPRASLVPFPTFTDALAPLVGFLDQVGVLAPDRRLLVILDEFDELPRELYTRVTLSDAFFLTLRSISSRPRFGFLLVGGEKMVQIMDCQGDKLNKWAVLPLDYFTRENDWTDYKELVQRPVAETIEYTERALSLLHEQSAGNPFFTKLICNHVFRAAVARRDCHVTSAEVRAALNALLRETERNAFQHFWEDGIAESGDRATEQSVRRRRVLIALSDVLGANQTVSGETIAMHALARGLPSLEGDLREFVARRVLVTGATANTFGFKVPLFRDWLRGRGVYDVIASAADWDAGLRARQLEEKLKVQASEIVTLVRTWAPYRGQTIGEDRVRAWLEQFGAVADQRSMFTILQHVRMYSHDFVRHKMKEADGIVRRGLVHRVESGKQKRADILVSYLDDSPAKSGAHFARLYADESGIYTKNVVERSQLANVAASSPDVQAVVFIDDFVGTGSSARKNLESVANSLAPVASKRSLKVVFVAVVAFHDGWRSLESCVDSLPIQVNLHSCELLDSSARLFGSESPAFPDPSDRERAKSIAATRGKALEKSCPLGYGDLGVAVVFERGCPNNTLPILWSESSNPRWVPLFKRH